MRLAPKGVFWGQQQRFQHQELTQNANYAKKMVRVRSKTVEPVIGTLVNFTNMKRVNTRGIESANKHVLMAKLETIQSQLNVKSDAKKETFLDNQEFLLLMKISKRTAQTWRDEGKISFSQVGNKIYYKLSDIENYLPNITINHLKADSMNDCKLHINENQQSSKINTNVNFNTIGSLSFGEGWGEVFNYQL